MARLVNERRGLERDARSRCSERLVDGVRRESREPLAGSSKSAVGASGPWLCGCAAVIHVPLGW